MAKEPDKNRLMINYNRLGTVSERELLDAFIDDLHIINDEFGIHFYSGAKLFLWGSNEWGDPCYFKKPCGGKIRTLDTAHFRPACLDYDI